MGGRGASSSSGGTQVFKGKTYKTLGSAKITGEVTMNMYNRPKPKLQTNVNPSIENAITGNGLDNFFNNSKYAALGSPIANKVPKGWKLDQGARTAPKGYDWYTNGKSRFGGGHEQVLVKTK